mgnify:CR=1 FL=1
MSLVSRFFKVRIEEYSKEQLFEVTRRVLEAREGWTEPLL